MSENKLTLRDIAEIFAQALSIDPEKPVISDLHLHPGIKPRARWVGKMRAVERCVASRDCPAPAAEDIIALTEEAIGDRPKIKQKIERAGGADFAFSVPLGTMQLRFRANAYRTLNGPALELRILPPKIPSLEKLNLPVDRLEPLVLKRRKGLFLVVGATGSGKSTTLASILDRINSGGGRNDVGHILTIEDPIEFVHTHRRAIISQREVGEHVQSFAEGLRQGMRQDPDVIMVGEIRDRETAVTALEAARTGHLVLSTLHSGDAAGTLTRLVSLFPPEEAAEVRESLAGELIGVLAQRLVPTKNGRLLIYELMENRDNVARAIAEGDFGHIRDLARDTGREMGYGSVIGFDHVLGQAVVDGRIAKEVALTYATSPANLEAIIRKLGWQNQVQTG